MTLPGRRPDHMNPRDFAEMICETHRRAGKPFTPELIKELAIELQAYADKLPFAIAQQYIRLFDPTSKKKAQRKREHKERRQNKEIYNFALSLAPHITDPITRETLLAIDIRERFSFLPLDEAKKIVRIAIQDSRTFGREYSYSYLL